MASIYDIARIKSGDPMYRAGQGAREASTALNRYRHEAEIIDEYNKAMKEAEKASKKGKLFGTAGSLLGGILSTGANMLAPGLGGVLGPLASGIGAGVMEKARQDKYGAPKKLRDLEKRLKGRKISKDIGATAEAFEEQEKAALMSTVGTNALMEYIMPTVNVEKDAIPQGYNVDDVDVVGESLEDTRIFGGLTSGLSQDELDWYKEQGYTLQENPATGEFGLFKPDTYKTQSLEDIYGDLQQANALTGEGIPSDFSDIYNVSGEDGGQFFKDFVTDDDGNMVEIIREVDFDIDADKASSIIGEASDFISLDEDAFMGSEYIDDSFLGGGENILFPYEAGYSQEPTSYKDKVNFMPGINPEAIEEIPQLGELDDFLKEKFKGKGLEDMKMLNNPIVLGLLRGLGPQVASNLLTPQIETQEYDMPGFRNPYGGY
tara:strand:+ start:114 stop:1412 length:1299 start_codon:yes stop_codon:yes gene_type:complete